MSMPVVPGGASDPEAVTNGKLLADSTEVVGNDRGNSDAYESGGICQPGYLLQDRGYTGTSWSYGNNGAIGNVSLGAPLVTLGAVTNDHSQE